MCPHSGGTRSAAPQSPDSPGSSDLQANFKLFRRLRPTHVPELLHQGGQQAAGDELLDLLAGSSGNVGQRPGRLFLHAGLMVLHQHGQDLQDAGVHGRLSLEVRAAHHVPDGAERRGLEKIREGQSPEELPG